MKLEINYRKKNGKNTNTWKVNNMPLIKQCVNEEAKEGIRKYLKKSENKNTTFQNLWILESKSSSKRKVYSNTGLTQKTRKILNKQSYLPSKGIRKKNKRTNPTSAEERN